MVTGSIYERKGIYYAIVSYYVDGRRKQKSVSTGLPVKGNKRRALEFLENLKRTYETKESMENMDGVCTQLAAYTLSCGCKYSADRSYDGSDWTA